MQVTTAISELAPKLAFSEILNFAYETFCSNKLRFMLTAFFGRLACLLRNAFFARFAVTIFDFVRLLLLLFFLEGIAAVYHRD